MEYRISKNREVHGLSTDYRLQKSMPYRVAAILSGIDRQSSNIRGRSIAILSRQWRCLPVTSVAASTPSSHSTTELYAAREGQSGWAALMLRRAG